MGWSFYKRFKTSKNTSVNISKSGPSFSLGPKGFKIVFSTRGVYVHFYKNGISYRKKIF